MSDNDKGAGSDGERQAAEPTSAPSSPTKSTEEDSTARKTSTVTPDGGGSPGKQGKGGENGEKSESGGSGDNNGEEDYSKLYGDAKWPLTDIKEPHENDVLYGRGGGTNHHPGNKRYRSLVEERKVQYVNSKRLEKPQVALDIIRHWRRDQDPPGRFLKMNEKTGHWDDVGDKKAREKTSQALREKAPVLRKQQQEEMHVREGANSPDSAHASPEHRRNDSLSSVGYGHPADAGYPQDYGGGGGGGGLPDIAVMDNDDVLYSQGITPIQLDRKEAIPPPAPSRPFKNTRFAESSMGGDSPDTQVTSNKSIKPSRSIPRGKLKKFTSLGTPLPDKDALDGFNWDQPVSELDTNPNPSPYDDCIPPPPPPTFSPGSRDAEDQRQSSAGSGTVPDYNNPSLQPLPVAPPPPPERQWSLGSVGSFNSAFAPVRAQNEGFSSQTPSQAPSRNSAENVPMPADGDFFNNMKQPSMHRDHSLAGHPLPHGSCQEPAQRTGFEDSRRRGLPPRGSTGGSGRRRSPNKRATSVVSVGSQDGSVASHHSGQPYDGTTGYEQQQSADMNNGAYNSQTGYGSSSTSTSTFGQASSEQRPYYDRQLSDQGFEYGSNRSGGNGSMEQPSYDYSRAPGQAPTDYGSSSSSFRQPQQQQRSSFGYDPPPTPGSSGLQGHMRQLSVSEPDGNNNDSSSRGHGHHPRIRSSPSYEQTMKRENNGGSAPDQTLWPSLPLPRSTSNNSTSSVSKRISPQRNSSADPSLATKRDRGGRDASGIPRTNKSIQKPKMKRDTSHQNENANTKKDTKMCRRAMGGVGPVPCAPAPREHSLACGGLDGSTSPLGLDANNVFSDEDDDTGMGLRGLPNGVAGMNLGGGDMGLGGYPGDGARLSRPENLSMNQRTTTLEVFAQEFGAVDPPAHNWGLDKLGAT